jgi:hypothetical protein
MSEELIPEAAWLAWAFVGAAYGAAGLWIGVRLFNRRERWAKWTALALAITPLLYGLSSGPLTIVAFSTRLKQESVMLPDGTTRVGVTGETSLGTWFPIAYAPLLWASEQEWGDLVFGYWEFFPSRLAAVEP